VSGSSLQFFVNALNKPMRQHWAVQTLNDPVYVEKQKQVFLQSKELRAGAVLAAIADKTVTATGPEPATASGLLRPPPGAAFTFSEVDVAVSEAGDVTSYAPGPAARRLRRFDRLMGASAYSKAMNLMTAKMLTRLAP
jgi:hypothetical protein